MSLENLRALWTPRALSVLRIMSGLIFMEHGTLKHLGFPASDRPATELLSLSGAAGIFELVGGAFLVLGLFTRPVAFVLSGVMASAYFIAHAPRGFFPVLNGGDTFPILTLSGLSILHSLGFPRVKDVEPLVYDGQNKPPRRFIAV